jgi:two-component system, OmpR family, response regulator
MNRILIAEDEPNIVRFLASGLQAQGYATAQAGDGNLALAMARTGEFDLMLLDLGLPGRDGLAVLTQLRREQVPLPIILLTARAAPDDIVTGLDSGADDYMSKPFRLAELLARVRLRLRAAASAEVFVLTHGDLSLDLRTRQARVNGRTVDLSAREYTLAEVLLRHPGQVLSREQLLSHVWGYDYDPGSNVVEVYIRYLRNKIGPDRIVTIRGIGYRLAQPPAGLAADADAAPAASTAAGSPPVPVAG